MDTSPTPGTFIVVGAPLSTEDTTLEAALPTLLAALPAALAALLAAVPAALAALLAAVPAALAALLAALPAALAAEEPMLDALEAMSLVASLAWEQLTTNAVAMAMPLAAAAVRANLVFIILGSPVVDSILMDSTLLNSTECDTPAARQSSKWTIRPHGSLTVCFP
jgi:hypothetical protein